MIFEQLSQGGCQSYIVGCDKTGIAAVIDPEIRLIDRYKAGAARDGLTLRYVIDTHTHADHFSAARELSSSPDVTVVVHRDSPAPFPQMRLQDGDILKVGHLRLEAIHTPGHTRDSMCLVADDRVFTGDTLLIGGTGRTDLPTGDPNALYDSLFGKLLELDSALTVYPAHDYRGLGSSTIGAELESNPRLRERDRQSFIAMMNELNLSMPTHLTEALRTNMTGGKSVARILAEATARTPFIALDELEARIARDPESMVVLDVRERIDYEAGHLPGAVNLPRGQLELRVDELLPDPTRRIVTVCEFGKVSTLAAATLRDMGFLRASALDGGMQLWRESGYPLASSE